MLTVTHLTPSQAGVTIKDLGGLAVPLHGPVVDAGLCDQGDGVQADPLPEHDVVRHGVRLHLRLHLDVEDLKGLGGCNENRMTCVSRDRITRSHP